MSETTTLLPRGIRNNNPGNINFDPRMQWQGQLGPEILPPGVHYAPRFARFDQPQNGIRAIVRTLMTYQDVHGLRSVLDWIKRWAPSADGNDPIAYAQFVADGVHPDLPADQRLNAPADIHDPITAFRAARRIIAEENDGYAYPEAVLAAAIAAAGIGGATPQQQEPTS